MRFVITGSGGFLGSHLVYYLLANTPHTVMAVSSRDPLTLANKVLIADEPHIADENPRLSFATNTQLLGADLLADGDVVVNCAFPWNRNGFQLAEGLTFNHRLYRRAAECGVRTFVNISSQSVYPSQRAGRASEGSELDLDSRYAAAKYATELLSAEILDPAVLVNARLGSLIGRGYDVRVVNRLIQKSVAGDALVVQGGDREFSFMDVRDACRALIAIGEIGAKPQAPIVNVGTEALASLHQIAQLVAETTFRLSGVATPIKLETVKDEDASHKLRYALDCTLVHSTYGFQAAYSLRETVEWIAAALWEDRAK